MHKPDTDTESVTVSPSKQLEARDLILNGDRKPNSDGIIPIITDNSDGKLINAVREELGKHTTDYYRTEIWKQKKETPYAITEQPKTGQIAINITGDYYDFLFKKIGVGAVVGAEK